MKTAPLTWDLCAECGRPVTIYNVYKRRMVKPDRDHDLCQRCWKAQSDRNREAMREEA